jgi:hypothetical protein
MSQGAEPIQQFQAQGYALVPRVIPEEQLPRLREAAERLIQRCRSGEHPWVRYSADRSDTWGAGKLFQPTSFEPDLIEAMAAEPVRQVTDSILGPSRLAVVSLLFNPERAEWDGPWHRDSQYLLPQDPDRQVRVVTAPTWCAQWNIALYEDTALVVVPGSHERWNTGEEQAVLDGADLPMPGATTVPLGPGDGVVYTPFLIHRGLYRPEPRRATLHFAYQRRQEPDPGLPRQWPDVPTEALAHLSEGTRDCLAMPDS